MSRQRAPTGESTQGLSSGQGTKTGVASVSRQTERSPSIQRIGPGAPISSAVDKQAPSWQLVADGQSSSRWQGMLLHSNKGPRVFESAFGCSSTRTDLQPYAPWSSRATAKNTSLATPVERTEFSLQLGISGAMSSALLTPSPSSSPSPSRHRRCTISSRALSLGIATTSNSRPLCTRCRSAK